MRHNAKKKDKEDPCFNGRMSAKIDFRAIINGRSVDKDVLKDLYQTRQYWENYLLEFDRLLIAETVSLVNQA